MKKRSQVLRILDELKKWGHITNREIMDMQINQPFQRLKELREVIKIDDIKVKTRGGTRFKVFYIDKRKAKAYIRGCGLIEC